MQEISTPKQQKIYKKKGTSFERRKFDWQNKQVTKRMAINNITPGLSNWLLTYAPF